MTDKPQMVKSAAARLRDGNPEPRVPCILLLDNSESMTGEKIGQLKNGVETLIEELLKNPQAARRVELAVVKFGGKVEVAQDFVSPSEFKALDLTAEGDTPMGAAIIRGYELLGERQARYEASDLDSYGPWVFLVTDGEATDSPEVLAQATQRIRQAENEQRNKQVGFFAVGVDGANMQRLGKIATKKRPPLKLQGYDFPAMFRWLAVSLTQVSMSQVGDLVQLENPMVEKGNPTGWAAR